MARNVSRRAGLALRQPAYNALLQRVRDVAPGGTTDEVYGAGGSLLWRYTGNSSDPNQRAYVPFNGGILAEYWSGGTLFDHPDELGSISASTDYTGNNLAERFFYPYGELWTGIDLNNFNMHRTFAKLADYDPEIDMYNSPHRHYSPNGRWPSPDPGGIRTVTLEDPQTWNRYAYARNNPTTLTDPSGLSPVTATNMAGNESDIAADWNPFWSNGAGPGVQVDSEYSREEYLAVAGPHNSTPQEAEDPPQQPNTDKKTNGPFIAKHPKKYMNGKTVCGSGQCVDFVKADTDVPRRATDWVRGEKVGPDTPQGAAIATFGPDGKYESIPGQSHAAELVSVAPGGASAVIRDQWKGQVVHERTIQDRGGKGAPVDDLSRYYVIMRGGN